MVNVRGQSNHLCWISRCCKMSHPTKSQMASMLWVLGISRVSLRAQAQCFLQQLLIYTFSVCTPSTLSQEFFKGAERWPPSSSPNTVLLECHHTPDSLSRPLGRCRTLPGLTQGCLCFAATFSLDSGVLSAGSATRASF